MKLTHPPSPQNNIPVAPLHTCQLSQFSQESPGNRAVKGVGLMQILRSRAFLAVYWRVMGVPGGGGRISQIWGEKS